MEQTKEDAAQDIAMQIKMAVISAALGINSLPEDELLRRLEGLAFEGFRLGAEASKGALHAASADLAKIVVAHMSGDAERLKATLDEFMATRVQVVVVPEKPSANVH